MGVLDKYRPLSSQFLTITEFQKYLFHSEAMKYNNSVPNRVAFVGSSSVISGINPDLANGLFIQHGIKLYPVNYGQPGITAPALPLLKNIFLDNKINAIVLVYNTFFFPREYPSPGDDTRWYALRAQFSIPADAFKPIALD